MGSFPAFFNFNRDSTSSSTFWSSSSALIRSNRRFISERSACFLPEPASSAVVRIARVVFFHCFLRPENIRSSSLALIFQAPTESLSLLRSRVNLLTLPLAFDCGGLSLAILPAHLVLIDTSGLLLFEECPLRAPTVTSRP